MVYEPRKYYHMEITLLPPYGRPHEKDMSKALICWEIICSECTPAIPLTCNHASPPSSGQSHAKYIPNVPWSKRLVFHSGKEDEDDEQVFTGSPHSIEYFDELGKSTLESEDVCRTLAKELKLELVESPDSVHLLWRLSRVLVHLSMHCDQQGRGEEERQLLVEGEPLSWP